ncbi:KpsF/GutQ family sugar-phosphate isomerase [Simkania negevensis]|uniref:KpsF/GutQ family sugar-phosphate isomerase n=1 Tax=Simkania negevensis TaxID=83561 RepID=A0ABS3AQW2_9BACT|nr:KpsF/GutQ family sugar-phosphate isomerase [Simkania negevensis]
MIKDLFVEQRRLVNGFFDSIDANVVEELVQRLLSCHGTVFFSGIGKSGFVAEKVATMMVSLGTKASYLSPTNTLHGDLGIVHAGDVFVFMSKSGESEELLHLVPFLRNKGVFLVAIVCNKESRLCRACDFVVELPVERELCPFDLAPTTSAAVQMIFGDIIAVALMKAKSFSIEEYASNHPAGSIGKRATLKVKDLMLCGEDVPLCRPHDLLVDVLVELSNKRCGCLVVADENKAMKGIFTDGDLRRALQAKGATIMDATLEELMLKTPRSIAPDVLAWHAMKKMEEDQKHPITVLPVIDDTRVVGIIKMHDIIQSGL